MENNEFELIVTIVNRGYSDYVIEASREAGASGGTILSARGTNVNEKQEKFMGVNIQPEKDLVLILVKKTDKNKIMKSVCEKSNLDKYGRGVCFSMPVTDIVGISRFNNKK